MYIHISIYLYIHTYIYMYIYIWTVGGLGWLASPPSCPAQVGLERAVAIYIYMCVYIYMHIYIQTVGGWGWRHLLLSQLEVGLERAVAEVGVP